MVHPNVIGKGEKAAEERPGVFMPAGQNMRGRDLLVNADLGRGPHDEEVEVDKKAGYPTPQDIRRVKVPGNSIDSIAVREAHLRDIPNEIASCHF